MLVSKLHDFQNKGRSRWTGTSCFVLEVPLCNLLTSMYDFVPCDRIVKRACYTGFSSPALHQLRIHLRKPKRRILPHEELVVLGVAPLTLIFHCGWRGRETGGHDLLHHPIGVTYFFDEFIKHSIQDLQFGIDVSATPSVFTMRSSGNLAKR